MKVTADLGGDLCELMRFFWRASGKFTFLKRLSSYPAAL
jgi:hypothetical protein